MLTSAVKGKRVYCETGFNNGHSALSVMQAEPNLVVHSFDIGKNCTATKAQRKRRI